MKLIRSVLFAVVASLIILVPPAFSQENQISLSFVLRQQTRLGYEPANAGIKVEGIYNLPYNLSLVAYGTALSSPKVDSGTGKSGFLSLGTRWAPVEYKGVRFFGEFDAILGALVTDPYRKTVFHFRNAVGVKLLDDRLLIAGARLYQDILPDAEKLLSERGFDTSALHTATNQLSAWEAEAQYWTAPLKKDGRVGVKGGARYSASRFVKTGGERASGWFLEFSVGPYWKF